MILSRYDFLSKNEELHAGTHAEMDGIAEPNDPHAKRSSVQGSAVLE
jgi:hypothetical protein